MFVTSDESALVLRKSGHARTLLQANDEIPGCGRVTSIYHVATGADGSIAANVFCFAGQAIIRVDPDGGGHEVALRTGMAISGLTTAFSYLDWPSVDGQGRIVVNVGSTALQGALVRQAKGAAPEVLLQTGDPLGDGTLLQVSAGPAVNAGGTVAFSARITDDKEVIATLTPGGDPVVLASAQAAALPPDQFWYPRWLLLPAVNDAGVVAFLRSTTGPDPYGYPQDLQIQRAIGGAVETIVAPGDPAPGGKTIANVEWGDLTVEASGAVLFGATTSVANQTQIYRFDGTIAAIAEFQQETADGETFWSASSTPVIGADGSLLFTGSDSAASGLFAWRNGVLDVEMRPWEPMAEPARFVDLRGYSPYPFRHLSSGPFMARGGDLIFDATVTGRERGLYARSPDGTLSAVALDGDAAPGGGTFDGFSFAFHSIADGGQVAFLGRAVDGPRYGLQLFAGVVGGPLTSVVAEEDTIEGFESPVQSLQPPSGINSSGALVIPAVLEDGRSVLLEWDGTALNVVAATGDTLSDGETIETIRTGTAGTGLNGEDTLLAPLLRESGEILFGVVTASGHAALYRMALSGGADSAVRVLGDGDAVEGGVLQPFLLEALSNDIGGRLAFQALPSPGPISATYSDIGNGVPRLVAELGEIVEFPTGPVLFRAAPGLAATTGGVVHHMRQGLYFSAPSPDGAGFDHVRLEPPDDGGRVIAGGIGPVFGVGTPFGGSVQRLGSDGDRYVVSLESTNAGREALVLYDLRPDNPPIAKAGPDQVFECTGPQGAMVTLDGSASSDPGQGALLYRWTFASPSWLSPEFTANGVKKTLFVPVGTWTITLGVRNEAGVVAYDSVVVTVQDTVAPSLVVRAAPSRLSPADGRLVPVSFALTMRDVCDPHPSTVLASIVSDDSTTDPLSDIVDATYGTDDRSVQLRARSGSGPRLTYTATYVAKDAAGNSRTATATVVVPRNRPR